MRPPLRDEEAIVLPGNKRVSSKVNPVVMPTIEAWPTGEGAPPSGTSQFVTLGRHAGRRPQGEPAGCG